MVMAVATSANASPQMQEALAKLRAEGRNRLKSRIDRGIREGELAPDADAASLADFYFTILAGMSMRAKAGTTRKSLIAIVETAMRAWPRNTKVRAAPRAAAAAAG
jgi:hypothetical protein